MDLLEPLSDRAWRTLELPETERIDRAAGFSVLRELFADDLAGFRRRWADVRSAARRIDLGFIGPRIAIEAEDGSRMTVPAWFLRQGRASYIDCARCSKRVCHHTLGAALCLAWHCEEGRALLSRSAWRQVLEPLQRTVPEASAKPAKAAEGPSPGWLRVVLEDAPAGDERERAQALAGGRVTVLLVPTAKRGGRALAPRPAPKSLSAIEKKVRLGAAERGLCRLMEQRRLMGHISRFKYADSVSVNDELGRLDAAFFEQIGAAQELVFGETDVQVQAESWAPTLCAEDAGGGALALSWSERALAYFPVGPGYVITGSHRLAPLDPAVDAAALALVTRHRLPDVPAAEAEAFLAEFAPSLNVPVDVRATTAVDRRAPVPVLRLDAVDGSRSGLRVDVRMQYGPHRVVPGEGVLLLPPAAGASRAFARDVEAEKALVRSQALALPRPLPALLRGDAAYDFLLDALPLFAEWVVEVDPELTMEPPKGRLIASVSFRSGIDWFDVEAKFTVDDWEAEAKPMAVIEAWREGRRYVALKGGGVAALPEAWLERHGGTLTELAALRKAGDGHLGIFAAPLAAGLLGEVQASEAVAEWQALAERLRGFNRIPERAVPPGLKATLRDYQHRGYRWMVALRDLGLGGVLADDMGLGKTVQTLAVLLDTHSEPGPASLVVAPTSVVHEWVRQAAQFAPSLRVALHHGSKRGDPPPDAEVDVVITSYALLRLDADRLARPWRMVVLDEAQNIKNPASAVARAARGLQAQARLALTGTPLENHLVELWSLFHFLMPGFFGSQPAFVRRYAHPIQDDDSLEALEALRRRIRPFVLRRLKREVAKELPPRQLQTLSCELNADERALYDLVRETYRDQVLGTVRDKGVKRSTILVLEALTRLRQACCDGGLLPFPEATSLGQSTKRTRLLELVDQLVEDGHRALVFSQWPSLLKRVRDDLDARGIPYLYLDGGTKNRGVLQTRWNHPAGPPLFLISLKAGGTGMNLTAADHVIHLDPWWNPAAEDQATDRAHRIGQTKPVMVYKLVAKDTVEEKILDLQARKRALSSAALDEGRLGVDALTAQDLEAVFGREATPFETPVAIQKAGPEGLPEVLRGALGTTGSLNNAVVRESLGLSAAQARAQLATWVRAGLLIKTGQGRATRYHAGEA
jgi:hypothetical protein